MVRLEIKSDAKDAESLIKSAIQTEIMRLEIGLKKTAKEMRQFEDKYNITSDTFLKEYAAEDLEGGDEEYVSWMGEIRIRRKIEEELDILKDIEYVDQRISEWPHEND